MKETSGVGEAASSLLTTAAYVFFSVVTYRLMIRFEVMPVQALIGALFWPLTLFLALGGGLVWLIIQGSIFILSGVGL